MTDRPRPPEPRAEEHTEPGVLADLKDFARAVQDATGSERVEALQNVAGGLWNEAKKIKDNLTDSARSSLQELTDGLQRAVGSLPEGVQKVVTDAHDNLVAQQSYKDLMDSAGKVNHITIEKQYPDISDPHARGTIQALIDQAAAGRPVTVDVQHGGERISVPLNVHDHDNGNRYYNLGQAGTGGTGVDTGLLHRVLRKEGDSYNLRFSIGPKEQTDSPTEA